ncbi:protein ALWAYS EARLY 3-like isoform X1 [Zingiber officinale]|uniref:protein ALWAYS EARLY 3-like isoform X1 n=1 Tax=Zingiber officinale TaxID=94328 RepID=UPI001C4C16CE|nr:protein ALWAYS EARLY 3-like isoform X1 [Zingiber officinale]
MASTRKLRNVNRNFAKDFEEWPEKDETHPKQSRQRKRKLSDMLGSRWSKDELEHFYENYRKYGKDWKKVAGSLRNRTSDMSEALYNMNKAYLSLPEGTATAAGLTAMMIDHYNNLFVGLCDLKPITINKQEGNNSDQERNDVARTSQKPQKRGRGKFRLNSKGSDGYSPDRLQNQSVSSRYGCLSLLKKKRSGDLFSGNQPRAVGKRTPRVPVSNLYLKDDKERPTYMSKQSSMAEVDSIDDEGAHVAAIALTEVLRGGGYGSPQVSLTPGRRVNHSNSSTIKSTEQKSAEMEKDRSKLISVQMDGECHEASLGSREAENLYFNRDGNEGEGTVGAPKRLKKHQGKRSRNLDMEIFQIDDDREACSGTEEGSSVKKIKNEQDMEIRDSKPTSGSSKKRSRQLFFGDENTALDALQTLADLSVNILLPSSAVQAESSAKVQEEQKNMDMDEKPNISELLPLNYHRDKAKVSGKRERRNPSSVGSDMPSRKSSKSSKSSQPDAKAIADMNLQAQQCIGLTEKRKPKMFASKIPCLDFLNDPQKSESQRMEVSAEEGKRFIVKGKRVSQVVPVVRQDKFVKPSENSSPVDAGRTAIHLSETVAHAATENQGKLLKTQRNRRKISLVKALAWKDFKPNGVADHPDKLSHATSSTFELKGKLSHCLSSKILRRWCMFEWFYSAIDYPWFAKSEFVEYLNHVRLGHIPRLTRVEWGVIRSSLGKPRRFSEQFLKEEREKLEQYRESVRAHYTDLRAGLREGLPPDLARPLSVGQRVVACHPKTREFHDGSVLTADQSRCRIQFDRPELGVEFVMDIDCMPLNPFVNIPEALRRNIGLSRHSNSLKDLKLDDCTKDWRTGSSMRLNPNESFDIGGGSSPTSATSYQMNTLMKQAKGDTLDAIVQAKATVNQVAVAAQQAMYHQPCSLSQIQEREADIRALAELSRALDKKEALLKELRNMNEEVSEKQQDGDTIKDLEHFRRQYAMVLIQLRDANDQVASALLSLRQRNTYHGNSMPSWNRPMENSGSVGLPETYNSSAILNQEFGSHVVEIVESSKRKARTMVDAAVKAMCTLKEGEDAFNKIGMALDLANNSVSSMGAVQGPPNSGHSNAGNPEHTGRIFDLATVSPKSNHSSDADPQIPSELISSCVSTLFMIQICTERQYPPAEIAQILDSALASLQPCSPHNLPIYREIETCMGIIKNQMLALIPTPSTITPEITTA